MAQPITLVGDVTRTPRSMGNLGRVPTTHPSRRHVRERGRLCAQPRRPSRKLEAHKVHSLHPPADPARPDLRARTDVRRSPNRYGLALPW